MTKSVLGKYWKAHDLDEDFVLELSRGLDISDFLARLIAPRIKDQNLDIDPLLSAHKFLDPKIKSHMPDPFHLLDMEKAVARAINALENKEKICIFADYDVDGATSSALLKNIFRALQLPADIYVPDRIAEGYGPTKEAMQRIRDKGSTLLITVDCGSMAFEALEYAADVGLEVIVIDHHISTTSLPKAVAVINPNRLDETSPHKNLAAVGVSFLFAAALCSTLKKLDYFAKNNISPPDLLKELDIVALGTVCDVMTLTGFNRALVAQGLKVAKERRNVGYRTLCDLAMVDSAISCYHLGFVLGPRINAGGRVGKSDLGARLLSTLSAKEALDFAKELDIYNNERKVIELTMLQEAYDKAEKQEEDPLLFITGEGWHPGVIGIVAGRLKEKYNKPVAVIALNNGIGKASCRSVRGIDFGCQIIEANEKGLLIAGGGHAMAAGFTVSADKLNDLHDFLKKKCNQAFKNVKDHLHEKYDASLSPKALNVSLVAEMERLAPFGNGNPAPVFMIDNLYVLKADIVGEKHIRVIFAPDRDSHSKNPVTAISFNSVGTKLQDIIMSRKPIDLSAIGTLKINSWQGKDNVQLHLIDLIVN